MIAPLTAKCSRCGGIHAIRFEDGRIVAPECKRAAAVYPTGDRVKRPDLSAPARQCRRFASTPTTRDGIRFASRLEADLYGLAKSEPGAVVIPHVRFPLHVVRSEGEPATWFTPDLLVMRLDVAGERWTVEAWEAKGAKACESRDYRLRARAFRATYPNIPLRVFRRVQGQLVED